MINIDLYTSIVDAKNIMNFVIYFCIICIIINFIISLMTDIFKRKSDEQNDIKSESSFGIIELLGGMCLVLIMIGLLPIYFKVSKYISILYVPSILLFFYVIYIKPMTSDRPSIFKFDYYEYGAILTWALFFFTKLDFKESFTNASSEGSLQVICIIILLFEIYSCIYCLLLNLYFVVKNLKKIKVNILIEKYEILIEKIYSKLDFSKILLNFSLSNKLIYSKRNTKLKKILLFLPYFTLAIVICLFKYIFSIFLSFTIKPILTMFSFIFSKIIQLSNTNENQINYGITKIVATISIVFVYIIIQMNDIFQTRIINTYEFISSVIIIPIILEAFISLKEKIKKKSE